MAETTDDRQPVGFAHYKGDHRHLAGRVEPMGPNYMGEQMWPLTAEYDLSTNITTVGFSHIPHPDALL